MKEKFFVPRETTKLLKKEGCKCLCDYYWMIHPDEKPEIISYSDKILYESYLPGVKYISILTYHQAIDWLERRRNVYISLINNGVNCIGCTVNVGDDEEETDGYLTVEEALNAAIILAIEMIHKNNKV